MPAFNRYSAQLLKRAIDSGITSPAELSNFMGQTSVESARFTHLEEGFGYTNVDRVIAKAGGVLTRRTREEVEDAVTSRDPERIANIMYDGHPRLRNTEPGDGWRFHGRGVIQLTGRDNYEHFGRKVGVDLIANPDLAKDPQLSADIAIAYWKERVRKIDPTDIRAATTKINGGDNSYEERVAAASHWSTIITQDLIEGVRQESISTDDLLAMDPVRRAPSRTTIRQGDRGDDVRELQIQLHDLGYPIRADGDFGPATRDAVMTFQRNHGLAADGIAGPRTVFAADESHGDLRGNPGPYRAEANIDPAHNVTHGSSIHDMFEAMCQAGAGSDTDALCHVGRTYGMTSGGQDWLMIGNLRNTQVTAEVFAAQQAEMQAQQQRGRVMSL